MNWLSRIIGRFRKPEPARTLLTQEEWQEWMNSLVVNRGLQAKGCVVEMREEQPQENRATRH